MLVPTNAHRHTGTITNAQKHTQTHTHTHKKNIYWFLVFRMWSSWVCKNAFCSLCCKRLWALLQGPRPHTQTYTNTDTHTEAFSLCCVLLLSLHQVHCVNLFSCNCFRLYYEEFVGFWCVQFFASVKCVFPFVLCAFFSLCQVQFFTLCYVQLFGLSYIIFLSLVLLPVF